MGLKDLQAELTLKMDQLTDICRRHGFDATPTVLLRHRDGWRSSVLLSNDKPDEIADCVRALASGDESNMSPHEAAVHTVLDG